MWFVSPPLERRLSGLSAAVVLPVVNVTTGNADAHSGSEELESGSLESLMVRYVEGDTSSFEELYRRLSPKLFGYLLRMTRQREQAEDLVQVTFSKVHRARDSYLKGAPLLPWVLAIARRSFFDARRRTKVRPEYLSSDGTMPEPETEPAILGNDVVEALELAMQQLPESYAEAIQLTKITGLSIAEASEVLGASKTAVKLRIHRGYKLLRKNLEAYGRDLLSEETPS